MSAEIRGSRLARYAPAVLAATTFVAIWLVFATSGAEAKGSKLPKPPKPVISGLTVSPSTVPSEGATTVTATVSGAETCTLSANRTVTSLPVTFPCEGESLNQAVSLPSEHFEKKSKVFKLKLTAVGKGGKVHALVEVTDSTRRYSDTATAVEGISGVTQLGVGAQQACAVLSAGNVSCWGNDREGQLLNGMSSKEFDKPVETLVSGATQVVGGGFFSCAMLSSGRVECSGNDNDGQLGDGNTGGGPNKPVEVLGLTEAVQVAAGLYQACALLADGHVECWGRGESGELGNGHKVNSSTPVEVQGISDATQITAGPSGGDPCALLATGHVECWGRGEHGELGDGSTADSDLPVEVVGVSEATHVSSGDSDACVLLSNGHIDCWGSDSSGLGDGSTTSSDVPVEVAGITNAMGVAIGTTQSCAALSTGHVECWGGNGYGQLGNGTVIPSATPVEVLGVDEVASLSAGGVESCALLVSASVQCWGSNEEGQLGNGTFI
jgi:alpha-tubulin suppressor-like RCC1 family protein